MANIINYLNTTEGAALPVTQAAVSDSGSLPVVGDVLMSPHDTVGDKYQLICNGQEFNTEIFPELTEYTVPDIALTTLEGQSTISYDTAATAGNKLDRVIDGVYTDPTGYCALDTPRTGNPAWIQIELNEPLELYGVHEWRYWSDSRVFNHCIIEVSSDGTNWTEVAPDEDLSFTSAGRAVMFEKQTVKYIRAWGHGSSVNDTTHWLEIAVYLIPDVSNVPTMVSPDLTVPYRIVADAGVIPSVGMITPSKEDKLYENSTDAINDLLLCDGSEVDIEEYPVLFDTIAKPDDAPSTTYREHVLHCFNGTSAFSMDYTSTTQPDVERNEIMFGNTYRKGIGTFNQIIASNTATGALTLVAEITKDDYPIHRNHWVTTRASNASASDSYNISTFQWVSSEGEVLLTIEGNNPYGETSYMTYTTSGGLSGSFTSTVSSEMVIAAVYKEDGVWYIGEDNGTFVLALDVDLDEAYKITVDALCYVSYTSSQYGAFTYLDYAPYSASLPTNTSPYPDYPDKIVADLTGG